MVDGPIHSLSEPLATAIPHKPALPSPTPSSCSETSEVSQQLSRPKLGSRKSSGTMIISREDPSEMHESEEEYEPDDVRSMSPKRSAEDVEKLGLDARQHLIQQAKQLQASLLAIVDRVETVKEEHEKLEGGNKFLQSYIGELIQTSQITSSSQSSSGAGKSKAKGRPTK